MSDQFPPAGQPDNQSGPDVPSSNEYAPGSADSGSYQPTSPYSPEPQYQASYTQAPVYQAPPAGGYQQQAYDPQAQQYYNQAQPGQYGYVPVPPGPRPTDGMAIASLVTGILGMALIPLILGILSLNKIKKTGAGGRGMAIAGVVLGALGTLSYVILAILMFIGMAAMTGSSSSIDNSDLGTGSSVVVTQEGIDAELAANPELKPLYEGCAVGDMGACDELYVQAPFDSVLEAYADSCGGTSSGGTLCKE